MGRQVARYQRDDQEFGRAIGFFDATYALALTRSRTWQRLSSPSCAGCVDHPDSSGRAPLGGLTRYADDRLRRLKNLIQLWRWTFPARSLARR